MRGEDMRKPRIRTNKQICIVCEGYEEFDYLDCLKKCGVWSKTYDLKLINAKSLDKIMPRYQYAFQSGNYDVIFIFCDTEIAPYSQYKKLINDLNDYHDKLIANQIVYFSNPCTMQLILSHFSSVKLTSNSKTSNAKKIHALTGVSDYDASGRQREAIMEKITANSYTTLKSNLSKISGDETKVPSTNFLGLLHNLESDDNGWIKKFNDKLYGI